MDIQIRRESPADYLLVEAVHRQAFGRDDEAQLVAQLRREDGFLPDLSLVAEVEGQLVGHILFTPIKVCGVQHTHQSLALAPVAVLPTWQNKGIGSCLIKAGLEAARLAGHLSVIVLGHETYYPKFGFQAASLWRIRAPFPVPDANFMALALSAGGLDEVHGVVSYPDPFNKV